MRYQFAVPEQKRKRVIVHTDCKNEADDPYALCHALMTPSFLTEAIVAGHFDAYPQSYAKGGTALASYDEVMRVLDRMGLSAEYGGRVYLGAPSAMPDAGTPVDSAGAAAIIREAMRDDPHPLYILMLGALTDLASAILLEPRICTRMTAVWVGGGAYPEGGDEFNLWNDIHAANVVFGSDMPLWQIPMNTYKRVAVSLAELQYRVQPCGSIGDYLFRQLIQYNDKMGDQSIWPHGETWGLGDQSAIAVLLEELERVSYEQTPAPKVDPKTMAYVHGTKNRVIRVYQELDSRFILEDFYAKLAINYGYGS